MRVIDQHVIEIPDRQRQPARGSGTGPGQRSTWFEVTLPELPGAEPRVYARSPRSERRARPPRCLSKSASEARKGADARVDRARAWHVRDGDGPERCIGR